MRLSAVPIVLGTTVSILFRMVSHMLTDQTVGTAFTNTLNECMEACDRTTSCVDVSYSSGTPGACYLKSSAGDIHRNSNIWGGRQLSGCTSQTSKLKRSEVLPLDLTPLTLLPQRLPLPARLLSLPLSARRKYLLNLVMYHILY
jgi:hypothetical protein